VAFNHTTGDRPDKDLGGRTNRITQNSAPPKAIPRSRILFTRLAGVIVLGVIVWDLATGRYMPVIVLGIVLAILFGFVLFSYMRGR
jgi:1,4-dihydroxy-2-naphthoate octaprenyltransferase